MDSKPWWKSKTIWFNALSASLAGLEMVLPQLASQDHPLFYGLLAMGTALGNFWLRAITTQAVK